MGLMGTRQRSVTEQVIAAVAELEGVDEQELHRPLYDVVDPDALDTLFRNASATVRFEYLGYDVTVTYGDTTRVDISPIEGV